MHSGYCIVVYLYWTIWTYILKPKTQNLTICFKLVNFFALEKKKKPKTELIFRIFYLDVKAQIWLKFVNIYIYIYFFLILNILGKSPKLEA